MTDDPAVLVATRPEHGPALAAIHAAAFPQAERWGADALALQLGLPGAFGFVSALGGFVLARVILDEAEILTLAVHPDARRRSLGHTLLGAAMAEAAARGARVMFLEVAQDNVAASNLYAKAGFTAVGRRPNYYPGGRAASVMRSDLIA